MAYVADDASDQLLVISSADGRNWSGDFVTNHRSPFAPTLVAANGRLSMAYVADDRTRQILFISSQDGHTSSADEVTHHQSKAAPAMAML